MYSPLREEEAKCKFDNPFQHLYTVEMDKKTMETGKNIKGAIKNL